MASRKRKEFIVMFDISWSHMLMFGVAAVVLIPTKDLPGVLRTAGRYFGDAQRLARDFRSQVSDALRETELAEIKAGLTKDMQDIKSSASMTEEARSMNEAMTKAASTADAGAASAMTATAPSMAATVAQTDAAAFGGGLQIPMTPIAMTPVAVLPIAVSQPSPAVAAVTQHDAVNGGNAVPNGQHHEPTANSATDDGGPAHSTHGIDIVRAGRGSVAQRAAAAWKITAPSTDSGA